MLSEKVEIGRTIRLELLSGTPAGIVSANSGRNLLAFRAPRVRLSELLKREEARRAGIYVLSGPDPDSAGRFRVYIGESESIRDRLGFHAGRLEFFDRAAILVCKDESLTKTHIRFVESELIRLARLSTFVKLENGTNPDFSRINDADRWEAVHFLEEARLVLPFLGFDFFRAQEAEASIVPEQEMEAADDLESAIFETNVSSVSARGRDSDEGFVVFAGSTARVTETETFPEALRILRQQLLQDGSLSEGDDGFYRFTRDVTFSSPSAAASVIAARNASGPLEWKHIVSHETYRSWREKSLKLVPESEVAR